MKDLSNVEVGDIVILKCTGDHLVPMKLNNTKAEVLKITKLGNFRVKPLTPFRYYKNYTIKPHHIERVIE